MLHIPVLIEPIDQNGYRARTGSPLDLCAEGGTEQEALQKLQGMLAERVSAGAKIVTLEVPYPDHPWLRMAGIYKKDDPLIEEWQKAIADYRNEIDNDPNVL